MTIAPNSHVGVVNISKSLARDHKIDLIVAVSTNLG